MSKIGFQFETNKIVVPLIGSAIYDKTLSLKQNKIVVPLVSSASYN